MSSNVLFAAWPYVALGTFAGGLVIRCLLVPRSSQAGSVEEGSGHGAPSRSSAPWRIAAGVLALGHLAGLLLPKTILTWNASQGRLYSLEAVAFASGLASLLWWTGSTRRQLRRVETPWTAELGETAFLSALGVALTSGLAMALLYRWSSSWGVMILTPYAFSILRGRPDAELADQLPYLAQLHVTAGCAALAVAPWTRLGSLFALASRRALHAMGKPLAGAGLAIEAWLRRRNPAAWLWPDED